NQQLRRTHDFAGYLHKSQTLTFAEVRSLAGRAGNHNTAQTNPAIALQIASKSAFVHTAVALERRCNGWKYACEARDHFFARHIIAFRARTDPAKPDPAHMT